MKSITILNNSSNPIIFFVTFKEEGESYLTEEKTPLFGPNNYKTINIPDNCTNIIISITIKISYGFFAYACSISLFNASNKNYQFVGSHKSSGLFELDYYTIRHSNYIYLSNKSISRIKGELSFNLGKDKFTKDTLIVKKNHRVAISIPLNAKNLNFAIFTLNLFGDWKLIDTFTLNGLSLQKCYEVINKNLNTSFSVNELDCSQINIL